MKTNFSQKSNYFRNICGSLSLDTFVYETKKCIWKIYQFVEKICFFAYQKNFSFYDVRSGTDELFTLISICKKQRLVFRGGHDLHQKYSALWATDIFKKYACHSLPLLFKLDILRFFEIKISFVQFKLLFKAEF